MHSILGEPGAVSREAGEMGATKVFKNGRRLLKTFVFLLSFIFSSIEAMYGIYIGTFFFLVQFLIAGIQKNIGLVYMHEQRLQIH